MHPKENFDLKGWCKFPYDVGIANWIDSIEKDVQKAIKAPENADWIRCNDTWFVGVNALENKGDGAVSGSIKLEGEAVEFIKGRFDRPKLNLDRGQISICYPGYPEQSTDETDASYQFRLKRDAAHIDGLLPVGPNRKRYLREPHAFILGIPLQDVTSESAPLVIWEGSHILAHEVFSKTFVGLPPDKWADQDITDIYHDLRRQIFSRCKRKVITAKLGESYLIHSLALHGIAPWEADDKQQEGRKVIYFRPELNKITDWLS